MGVGTEVGVKTNLWFDPFPGFGERLAHSMRGSRNLQSLRQRLLIDIQSEARVVCQNGTLVAQLRGRPIAPQPPFPPPYPLHTPSTSPPKQRGDTVGVWRGYGGPQCAILAQFGVSRTLESRWKQREFRGSDLV